MSAVGHCGDNAACEAFFGMLKRERVYRMGYPTLDAARADVFACIERFHNPRMRRRVARQDQKVSAFLQPSMISGWSPLRQRRLQAALLDSCSQPFLLCAVGSANCLHETVFVL